MPGQQYKSGNTYIVISSSTFVFDNISKPNVGISTDEFQAGYMLSRVHIEPRPTNVICLQVFDKYLQFLWGEKTIWLYRLDADACLRPLLSGYNQI